MISYYKRVLKDAELRSLPEFEKGCWINVIDPSHRELDELSEKFRLDKQNLLSGLDKNELPRVEFIENDLYIFVKIIEGEKKDLHTLLIIIGEEYIMTLCKDRVDFIQKIADGKEEFFTSQKLKCLIRILSMINKDFERHTLSIVKRVNSKREDIGELTEKDINELLEHESTLNNFLSSYYYTNLLYQRIVKKVKFYDDDREILKDLIIEAQQGLDSCRSSLQTISNIRNHFVILMSNKLNKILTILTIFTIAITIPAAVSGLFGMNVALPLQQNPYVFYMILGFIAMTWIGSLLYFKKMKFI